MHLAYKLENVAFTLEGEETSACWHSFKLHKSIDVDQVYQRNNNIECNVLNMSFSTALKEYLFQNPLKSGKYYIIKFLIFKWICHELSITHSNYLSTYTIGNNGLIINNFNKLQSVSK